MRRQCLMEGLDNFAGTIVGEITKGKLECCETGRGSWVEQCGTLSDGRLIVLPKFNIRGKYD